MPTIDHPGFRAGHRDRPGQELVVRSAPTGTGWTRITVEGELDASNASNLELVLDQLRRSGEIRVELDLCHLHFLDSSGLRAIVTRRRVLLEAGGQLRLVDVPLRLQRVFELSGLAGLLG